MLAVPIHGAEDEVLELPKDQLPDDPNEIMQILANELAPLKLWLELAVSYYQQQRIDQFTVVMETSTGEEGPLAVPSLVPWRLVPPFADPLRGPAERPRVLGLRTRSHKLCELSHCA
jgi:hypothetical protein